MDAVRQRYEQLAARFDALAQRERALIFVAVLVVLYVVAVNILFSPLWSEQTRLQQSLTESQTRAATAEAELQMLLAQRASDPDSINNRKLQTLQQQLRGLDSELADAVVGLVSPKEMAQLVEKILVAKPELHVVRVESLPPDALGEVAPAGAGGKTDAASGDAGIYRYGMRIEFRGSYNDIVRYLAALEALPWKVFWGQMNVEMVKYPTLKLVLTVYTLGLSEEWAGEHPET